MDKAKKVIITLIINLILLGIIVFSVYMMVTRELSGLKKNLFSGIIVACIPMMFLITFINTSWEKYDDKRPQDSYEDSEDNLIEDKKKE